MIKALLRAGLVVAALVGYGSTAIAADYTIRATANSNENDEDYDGLIVFKNFVESASNGAIAVELFIGTQLCSNSCARDSSNRSRTWIFSTLSHFFFLPSV